MLRVNKIKIFLKKIVKEQQYEKLKIFKGKVYLFFESMLLAIIKILPDRILLFMKSKAEVIKKMDYEKCEIFLNIDSEIEYQVRLHSCKKEPEMIEWIQTFLRKGDVFYDIGANVGAYSLVASKYLNGNVKVYSFEPGFMTFPNLCKNILINNCSDSIIPLQIALSDQTVINNFNYNNLTPGGALHALGKPIDYKGDIFEPVFRQPVLAYRIDDLIKQFRLPIPNHIKIDVDGIEYKILKGAEKTLKNPLVKSLILELEEGSEEANKIIDFLERLNFRVHSKYAHGGNIGPFSKMYNYIFHRFSD